jgi:hypothetical protein
MTDAPTNYLPALVRSGTVNDWERKFCASMIARTRKGLRLTDKQAATLRKIVERFRRDMMDDGGVIE